MQGKLNVSQIVEHLRIELEPEFPRDYLTRKSVDDCQLMRINGQLIPLLQAAQATRTAIVLATDNMDCFHDAIQTARTPSAPVRESESTPFYTISRLFDDVLCSSEQRILKSEDPQRFFEDWLSSHVLDFSDALLLDDLENNCNAFRTTGGTAIQITHESLEKNMNKVSSEVESWLRTANGPA
ncbi:hypothetical protein [Gimesia sp.]|uniref:hypothetical protein n=1 Tax=Gimesia sp. TaxID=2024833 RepID=UPI003A90AD8B